MVAVLWCFVSHDSQTSGNKSPRHLFLKVCGIGSDLELAKNRLSLSSLGASCWLFVAAAVVPNRAPDPNTSSTGLWLSAALASAFAYETIGKVN